MDLIQTVILAIVQGITELLPISSSGHLVLFSKLLNLDSISTYTLTILHLGTTLAIVIFNWKFLFTDISSKMKLYTYIILATVPAALLGVLFGDVIESFLRRTEIVAGMLIVIGAFMIYTDHYINTKKNELREVSLEKTTLKQTFLAGLSQSLALIPGVSRSGITTITGVFSGMSQYSALRLSFLLGIPILMGSFFYTLLKTENGVSMLFEINSLVGIVVTFVIGYISLWFLEKISKTRFLKYFGIYRIALGLFIFAILA